MTFTPQAAFRAALVQLAHRDGGVRCFICHREEPAVILQAHHVIPQRILRRLAGEFARARGIAAELAERILISDARNGILVCEVCHGRIEKPGVRRVVLRRADLPRRFTAFEQQFDLAHVFERIYVRPVTHPKSHERADTAHG